MGQGTGDRELGTGNWELGTGNCAGNGDRKARYVKNCKLHSRLRTQRTLYGLRWRSVWQPVSCLCCKPIQCGAVSGKNHGPWWVLHQFGAANGQLSMRGLLANGMPAVQRKVWIIFSLPAWARKRTLQPLWSCHRLLPLARGLNRMWNLWRQVLPRWAEKLRHILATVAGAVQPLEDTPECSEGGGGQEASILGHYGCTFAMARQDAGKCFGHAWALRLWATWRTPGCFAPPSRKENCLWISGWRQQLRLTWLASFVHALQSMSKTPWF